MMHHQFLPALGSGSPQRAWSPGVLATKEILTSPPGEIIVSGARACKVYHSTTRGLGVPFCPYNVAPKEGNKNQGIAMPKHGQVFGSLTSLPAWPESKAATEC